MTQAWVDLLFAHWPVDKDQLRSIVPPSLEIDTFDGAAWIGIVPFGMENVHWRIMPPVPLLSKFLELNVRTYVRYKGRSGIFFFSLDCANRVAVEVARTFFRLPYYNARMSKQLIDGRETTARTNRTIIYRSERIDKRGGDCLLDCDYRVVGEPFRSSPGSIEEWLTERYCFFTPNRSGQIVVGEVHHKPWPLQIAEAEFRTNSLAKVLGVQLPQTASLLHYSAELETLEFAVKIFAGA